jgi:hypothetical protein
VIFSTCFAISARAVRGSPVNIDCNCASRASTNLRVSRIRSRTAPGSESSILVFVSASSLSNSADVFVTAMAFTPHCDKVRVKDKYPRTYEVKLKISPVTSKELD